jgi:hypothetical protein
MGKRSKRRQVSAAITATQHQRDGDGDGDAAARKNSVSGNAATTIVAVGGHRAQGGQTLVELELKLKLELELKQQTILFHNLLESLIEKATLTMRLGTCNTMEWCNLGSYKSNKPLQPQPLQPSSNENHQQHNKNVSDDEKNMVEHAYSDDTNATTNPFVAADNDDDEEDENTSIIIDQKDRAALVVDAMLNMSLQDEDSSNKDDNGAGKCNGNDAPAGNGNGGTIKVKATARHNKNECNNEQFQALVRNAFGDALVDETWMTMMFHDSHTIMTGVCIGGKEKEGGSQHQGTATISIPQDHLDLPSHQPPPQPELLQASDFAFQSMLIEAMLKMFWSDYFQFKTLAAKVVAQHSYRVNNGGGGAKGSKNNNNKRKQKQHDQKVLQLQHSLLEIKTGHTTRVFTALPDVLQCPSLCPSIKTFLNLEYEMVSFGSERKDVLARTTHIFDHQRQVQQREQAEEQWRCQSSSLSDFVCGY